MSKDASLRILHINDVAHVASNLIKGQTLLGDRAELFNPIVNVSHSKKYSSAGILIRRMRDSRRISRIIKNRNIDIVHVHYAYMAPLVWLSGREYFLHCHGSDITKNLYRRRFRWITRKSILKARVVFYSTPNLKNHLIKLRSDAVFIPNPVDTDFFSPSHGESANNGRITVFIPSRLNIEKGVDIAIEGIRIARRKADFDIVAFDHGLDGKILLDAIKEKIPGAKLHPETDASGMLAQINRSDIVLAQLRTGILSVTEQEAMSAGKPVITRFDYADFYDSPPPILQARNSEEVAEQILKLVADSEERRRLGEKARQWVIKNHDYRAVSKMVRGFYEKQSNK